MQILDGKAISNDIKNELRQAVADIARQDGKIPHLCAILVGDNPASHAYVNNKVRFCKEVGFEHTVIRLPQTTTQAQLITQVERLNQASNIDGFIVQLPLPAHIDADTVLQAINPDKDVDGFHPANIGRMTLGLPSFIPATPMGILELLKRYNIETSGKHCVVVGRSNIVGTPMSILLSRSSNPGNCTVTLCHSKSGDLSLYTKQADILIAAIGKPNFITAQHVKPGAVVIDVGINRINTDDNGSKLVGDVDFDAVAPLCSYITPVPGGVGAMTVAALLLNTLRANKLAAERKQAYAAVN
ncbi:MAG: bifunctional methylenetetrahydrofolate dehydrogenase/methenyltetrahydrofolate cyclohydrolase FolD [Sphingobacteriales bacterium]|jgi:methylenetetrahydrofolate dehydrogenase (NADP+)/methenyltetrahydrofolate cyclohydrolase|nr:bifunctional methylenetetrahydrofolate dehydrogenase/methenyltetrahydrofolate cyclohydrolase FolD [Sphingobacteriales bacterium]MBP9141591.1 bifunctional methylenetetrahydrofolate dehydrogenase/methenyltetrahydrofolate cyclohydrolase FolD [Chitinophagales bacterium]MDA0198455.1 bifunctional methylenetetrahydrofolate dehydrogenase/methenyltetrahydrofolate cyclohydrolase FolD [Bacteroidota bacterium]MBK6890810.1 bifunctional methylenetetrahydrofolate dehydrogenase/methenyltetrahydrofolate cyclo